jgi:hypothetical protein
MKQEWVSKEGRKVLGSNNRRWRYGRGERTKYKDDNR